MLKKSKFVCCNALLTTILVAGCASTPPSYQTPLPEIPKAGTGASQRVEEINQALSAASQQSAGSSRDYRLGPDDLVQITIYNVPEAEARATPRNMTLRVSQDGMVVLPLIGQMEVRGKTPAELEYDLSKRYEKYIRNPQIGVSVMEFRQRVSVMGAVQKPGMVELTGPRSVVDALAVAGGVTERAGNQVHVYRQDANGARQSMVIDLAMLASGGGQIAGDKNSVPANMLLQAGDVVNVPSSGMFFVDGAVGKPGSYPLGRSYTLSQALAIAGGVNPELADYSGLTINRRRSPENLEIITVDLDAVTTGRAPDPQLQADDVVLVPMSSFKYFVRRFVGTIFSGVSAGTLIGIGR